MSGYRTPKYNKKVGGVPNSFHIQGRVSDITVNCNLRGIVKLAKEIGYRGIGIYTEQSFVHVDNRDIGPSYWIKHVNKPYIYVTYEDLLK